MAIIDSENWARPLQHKKWKQDFVKNLTLFVLFWA